MKKTLLSGIKPTGSLTLGNYIGAIKNFVLMQKEYDSYVFVADLHALSTGVVDPVEFNKARKSIIAMYIACGLDYEKTTLFYQSDIMATGVLQWLCTSLTTIGELSRMTQFKDKSSKMKQGNGTEKIPTGLLMYPPLMAADILLYNTDVVPIGEDQIQHLELTRNIAERFNSKYNLDLKIPTGYVPKVGARIRSLTDPNFKMSKSDSKSEKSIIYLLDDPDKAYSKIMKAVTDSENKVYVSEQKPGVLNLLNIYASIKEISLEEAEKIFADYNYKDFKSAVGNAVKDLLIDIQSKYYKALEIVDQIAKNGAKKANIIANKTLSKIMKNIGFEGEINESK
ncbi:tryptophan--tRNA ligase [Mycoplasma sp. CSL10137]|uniref:tryptophan--tRNA ligase n=1 Tax=unclassified Mycoplasma TaxID=2683645 RepID=UPI00197C7FB4|nr:MULTISPECIES: tryptophan--tRNA ligase [unclassified Mycoplasma]MBN4083677.1 tryptophan--tRNA ligase [Mycoplasma sp. CSL10137]MBU4693169.1 tryptophan--tRNA ligase [Mycoplasma sp. CSL7491-lung]